MDEDYAEFDKVLTSLEEQKRLYQDRQQAMSEMQRKLEELQRNLADEQDKLTNKKNEVMGKARDEAAQLLRQARREAEDIIAQLKAQFSGSSGRERQQAIEGARRRLSDSLSGVRNQTSSSSEHGQRVTAAMLSPGAMVYVTSIGQKGIVQAVAGNAVTVQLGIMKMSVPLENCRLLDECAGKDNNTSGRLGVTLAKSSDTPRQIDIRGTTIEEAENIIGKYLDDVILAGLSEAIIIHGKGTGALRKGIRAYLKAHRSVKEINIGEVNQGGDGVTVVKLR